MSCPFLFGYYVINEECINIIKYKNVSTSISKLKFVHFLWIELCFYGCRHPFEALESVMCDVIKIRLKRRDATRILRCIAYIGDPSFKIGRSTFVLIFSGWFPFPLLVAILLFRRIFMTSHMTLSSASWRKYYLNFYCILSWRCSGQLLVKSALKVVSKVGQPKIFQLE